MPRELPPNHMYRHLIISRDLGKDAVRRGYLKHSLDIAVRRDAPILPEPSPGSVPRRFEGLGRQVPQRLRPEIAALSHGDDEEKGKVEGADAEDVYLVEPPGTDYKFQGNEEEQGEDVEGGLVGEDGIAFDSFEGEDCVAKLDFGCGVGDDGAEGVGKHRHEDGEEEGVSQEGECDHEGWA